MLVYVRPTNEALLRARVPGAQDQCGCPPIPSSCTFCEQEGYLAAPSHLFQARSLSLQGWGLIDLPLRASNEGSPRPRVARAQKIISLHPFPPPLTAQQLPPYDAGSMRRNESGNTNLAILVTLVGIVIAGVWVWKRLSFDTQDYVIDQAVPMAFAGLVIAAGLFILVRMLSRRRAKQRERGKLLASFERATTQEKKLEIAFALMEVNEYQSDGLESVIPALRDLFATTLQRALGDEQNRIRGMAASYLGALNDKTVIPLLLKALEDDHAYVRSSAALGLGRLRAGEAKEKLTIVMKEDWDQTVRSRSKEALERIK
jgi:HEAT repeats